MRIPMENGRDAIVGPHADSRLTTTYLTDRDMISLLSEDVFDFFGHFSLDFVLEGRFSSSLYATFHF